MNKELLNKVKEAILENPDHVDMNCFYENRFDPDDGHLKNLMSCHTTACIAGWACFLEEPDTQELFVEETAIELLSLSSWEAELLFFLRSWPEDLKNKYDCALYDYEVAETVAERIDRFIATEGKE